MEKTTSQVKEMQFYKDEENDRVGKRVEDFTKQWEPSEDRDKHTFRLELRMLITEVTICAQRPFIEAAAREIANTQLNIIRTTRLKEN